jgi:hypothetical protein
MLDIKTTPRDSPYYKDYHYSAQFYLQNAPAIRNLSHSGIDAYVNYRKELRAYTNWDRQITPANEQKLHNVCNLFLGFIEPCKRMVYSSHVYFYTNCFEDLKSVAQHPDVKHFEAVKADICLPKDVVLLKDPKRKFRTYFKERWIPEGQTPILRNFLLNRQDCYDFTPMFKQRLANWDRFYTMSHFFIDHDDPKDLLMLELVVPGLIRKTMPIQAK